MSETVKKAQVETHQDRQHTKSNPDTQRIQELDERLKQLGEHIIPLQPYLLSVPSDLPYRYSSRFFNSWFIGTPFKPNEEELQYMSFLPHQHDDEVLLKVVGGWADADGNPVEDDISPAAQLPSGPNTPLQQPNRKKISLKDYKTKDKGREGTPVPSLKIQSMMKDNVNSGLRENVVKDVESVKMNKRDDHKVKIPALHDTKRSDIKRETAKSPILSHKPRSEDLPSPSKRRKLSDGSSSDDKQPDVKTEESQPSRSNKALPRLLSPTLPASEQKKAQKQLPELLSPALPPSLEKAIAKAEAEDNHDIHITKRSDAVKSILSNALGSPSDKKIAIKDQTDPGRARSDSQLSAKSLAATTKVASPLVKPLLKTESRPSTPLQNGSRPSPGPRQRHSIVLKYGKKHRKRIESLLRFPPRPKKPNPLFEEQIRKTAEVNSSTNKLVNDSAKPEKKRLSEMSPERPAKKIKSSNLLETPDGSRKSAGATSTTARSPVPPTTAIKTVAELTTPRRELKPSAMQRLSSSDGMDVRTPPIGRTEVSTPASAPVSTLPKRSPVPGSTAAARDADRSAWHELIQKYFALGRTLKREGTALSQKPSDHDQALSVVLSIEAILCFMINLAANAHTRPNLDPGWQSMMPYQIQVFRASRKYKHLHGLVIQLGAICRQMWHTHNIDRLSKDPLPEEHCGSAPTPGSDGNTKTDDSEKYKKKYIEFRDQLVQNSRELQTAWLEGSRHLSPYLIEQEYPRTWVKRTKNGGRRGTEKPNPNMISKEFYLPLDTNSTVFEAMRFTLAILDEWTTKEKITWKTRIEL